MLSSMPIVGLGEDGDMDGWDVGLWVDGGRVGSFCAYVIILVS